MAKAHDVDLHRHDTELSAWTYEDPQPRDKTILYTMTYKAKTNQFRGLEKYKARCVIRDDRMKPGVQFYSTLTATNTPSQTVGPFLHAAAVED